MREWENPLQLAERLQEDPKEFEQRYIYYKSDQINFR